MARWKLMTSHYLNTADKTEWEYREISNVTNKEVRRRRLVPRYLDVNDPGDWNNRFGDIGVSRGGSGADGQGEIIVCQDGKGNPSDIVFFGDPTPDMAPLDDEAREISASFTDRWAYKPDTAEISYSQSQAERITAMIQTEAKQIEVPGLNEMAASIAQLAQQNAELLALIASSHTSGSGLQLKRG